MILPEEQMGCRQKKSRITGNVPYIDKMVLEEAKRERKFGKYLDRLPEGIRHVTTFVDLRVSEESGSE